MGWVGGTIGFLVGSRFGALANILGAVIGNKIGNFVSASINSVASEIPRAQWFSRDRMTGYGDTCEGEGQQLRDTSPSPTRTPATPSP